MCLGKHMKLSPEAEEVATFFAKMLDHEYTTKDIFRKNFFKDWRKVRVWMESLGWGQMKKCCCWILFYRYLYG